MGFLTLKVDSGLFNEPAYCQLPESAKLLFWHTLATSKDEGYDVSLFAWNTREADQKELLKNLKVLENAGFITLDDEKIRIVAAVAHRHTSTPASRRRRARIAAGEIAPPKPRKSRSQVQDEPNLPQLLPAPAQTDAQLPSHPKHDPLDGWGGDDWDVAQPAPQEAPIFQAPPARAIEPKPAIAKKRGQAIQHEEGIGEQMIRDGLTEEQVMKVLKLRTEKKKPMTSDTWAHTLIVSRQIQWPVSEVVQYWINMQWLGVQTQYFKDAVRPTATTIASAHVPILKDSRGREKKRSGGVVL